MVSGRAAATLGLRALLAPRRRADLARREPDCARGRRSESDGGGSAASGQRHRGAARHRGGLCSASLRGPGRPDGQARLDSRQHRPQRSQDRRPARTRAHLELVRPPFERPRRLRAAGTALDRAGEARMAQRSVADPARSHFSGAGQLAHRLPPATAVPSLRRPRRVSASPFRRSFRRNRSRCPIRASRIRSALTRYAHRPGSTPRHRSRPRR